MNRTIDVGQPILAAAAFQAALGDVGQAILPPAKNMPAVLLFLCSTAWAQIAAPTLGFVPDGFRIRTMRGIPAAGAVGPILSTGRDLALIAISPRQDHILATAADTGEVLLIVPGHAAVAIPGASANPDTIAMSPSGSSAVLWFNATNRAQIVSGLPAAASIREIDASFLHASPTAIAVSDDGNWLAVGTFEATGAFVFAQEGSMSTVPIGDFVTGLAFFHNRSELVISTSSLIFTADPVYTAPPVPVGNLDSSTYLAVSADNQRIVAAEGSVLTTIGLATGSISSLDCGCQPEGLFGLGGSIFRLTSTGRLPSFSVSNGPHFAIDAGLESVRLFDAENNRILAVPLALSEAPPSRTSSSPRRIVLEAALPALPAVTIGGLPASSGPAQQPAMTISIASAYPVDITGAATLTFASSVGGDDQTIQFGTGGRTVAFTIPAGSTQASFSGKANVAVLTGTVAGAITITLDLMASGTDVTPTPPPTATIALITTPTFIQTVQFGTSTAGAFTVVVTGFSTTRDMVSGTFQFAPSTNATLATPSVTVSLGEAFAIWYSNSASSATGSEFMLTVPFTTTNGPSADIVAVTVTLTNSKGASSAVVNSQ